MGWWLVRGGYEPIEVSRGLVVEQAAGAVAEPVGGGVLADVACRRDRARGQGVEIHAIYG